MSIEFLVSELMINKIGKAISEKENKVGFD